MSRADWNFLKTTNSILKDGTWDTKEQVRPKWQDGTPAHTAKIFAARNVYKLSEEFPIITLRDINWKAAIDEVLWIWQLKSNNIKDLHSHIWDAWADKNGSIGKAYGWQAGQKAQYSFGEADQIDMIRHLLKNTPANRAMIAELFVHKDLHEMGLNPCVHHFQLDVADGKLNMFLLQRSNDTLAAGSWNVVQYAALQEMLAKEANLKPGVLCHDIVNSHIYDRHIPYIIDMTLSRAEYIKNKLPQVNPDDIDKYLSQEEQDSYMKFEDNVMEFSTEENVSFNFELTNAKAMEISNAQYDAEKYEQETKRFVKSPAFLKAEYIVNEMAKHPNYEKVLGFSSPKLILAPKTTNFYDFKSPLTRDESGKNVSNPESSFSVVDYDPKKEGIKLQTKVPVAE